MLKALAKSFTRQNRYGEVVTGDMWTADFVKGKGSGLIFLLHGRPGVGKTCTAGKCRRQSRHLGLVFVANPLTRMPLRVYSGFHTTTAHDTHTKRHWSYYRRCREKPDEGLQNSEELGRSAAH